METVERGMRVPSLESRRPQRAVTARQRRVLECIADRARAGLPMPTLRELGSELDIRSTNGVNDHLVALERKGMIERGGMKSRYIKLTEAGLGVCRLPKLSDHERLKAEVIEASKLVYMNTTPITLRELNHAVRLLIAYEATL